MRAGRAWVALSLLGLGGCEAVPPGSPYPLHSGEISREARRAALPRREDAVPAPPVAVQWLFSAAAAECVATTSGPARAPVFTARVDRAVRLSAAPGGGASRLAFSGPGGSWTLRTPAKGRDASATMPLDGAATGRLLALLAGGRLKLEGGAHPATLILPDAGVSGRDWMGCVSTKAHDAAGRGVAGR